MVYKRVAAQMVSVISEFLRRMHVDATLKLASPSFLSIPLTLLAVPLCLSAIGLADYGTLLLLILIVNQSHILLLGAEKNLIRQIISSRNAASQPASHIGGAASFVALIYGCLVAIIAAGLLHITNLDAHVTIEPAILYCFLAGIPLHFLWSVQRSILQANEHLTGLGIMTFLYMATVQYMPLAIILLAPERSSLMSFLVTAIGARALVSIWLLARGETSISFLRPNAFYSGAHIKAVFGLIGYGKWMGINQSIQILFDGADRYLIGLLGSPAAVALYSVPLQVSQKIAVLPVAMAQIIFNRSINAQTSQSNWYLFVLVAAMPIGAALFFCVSDPFFKLWLGSHFSPIITSLSIMTFVAIIFTSVNFITGSILEGAGRARELSMIDGMSFFPLIGLMAILTYLYGPMGTAAAVICKEILFSAMRLYLLKPPATLWRNACLAVTVILADGYFTLMTIEGSLASVLSVQVLIICFWTLFIIKSPMRSKP